MKLGTGVVIGVVMAVAASAVQAGPTDVLPFNKSMAQGADLPAPLGVGLNVHYQAQGYDLSSIEVNMPGVALGGGQIGDIDNEVTEANVKLDAWILPFLNVFGLVGLIDGETDVEVLLPIVGDQTIEYDGSVFGCGAVVSAGYRNAFASLTGTYTDTDLDAIDSSIVTVTASPRAGMVWRKIEPLDTLSVWLGAMYQDTEEKHEGTWTIMNIPVGFSAELEGKEPWNYLAGAQAGITRNWSVECEIGVGERTQATASAAYRF